LTLYDAYERQQLQAVDRALPRLLNAAMDALIRLLNHPDWRAKAVQRGKRPE
jgi:hypothetical protein